MNQDIFKKINEKDLKKRPEIKVGDTVKLHMKIREGSKERTQIFEGVVISQSGSGKDSTLTVRKISYGVGVERVVPLQSPTLIKVEVVKRGSVKKSKMFFLRKRIGKSALKVNKIEDIYLTDEVEEVLVEEVAEAVEEKRE
jgi:large subunit ribosomal protein L19